MTNMFTTDLFKSFNPWERIQKHCPKKIYILQKSIYTNIAYVDNKSRPKQYFSMDIYIFVRQDIFKFIFLDFESVTKRPIL